MTATSTNRAPVGETAASISRLTSGDTELRSAYQCRGSRYAVVCRAAAGAALHVTVEKRMSLRRASSSGVSTSSVALRRARSWICGPRSAVVLAMS